MLLPLQGVPMLTPITQGDALGYVLVAPAGRIAHNLCAEVVFCILLIPYFSSSAFMPSALMSE